MCCRYFVELSPELRPIVEEMNRSPLADKWRQTQEIKTYGEIFPADVVPVIAPDRRGQRAVYPMRWGFREKTLLMNARAESAATRPTFRKAWAGQRCIVPASWYFEWEHLTDGAGRKKTGTRYMIQPKGSQMTWLGGLYRIEDGLPVFVILTREASADIRFIHDRMPLILPEHLIGEWIRPDGDPEALLSAALTEMNFERSAEVSA